MEPAEKKGKEDEGLCLHFLANIDNHCRACYSAGHCLLAEACHLGAQGRMDMVTFPY